LHGDENTEEKGKQKGYTCHSGVCVDGDGGDFFGFCCYAEQGGAG